MRGDYEGEEVQDKAFTNTHTWKDTNTCATILSNLEVRY